MLVEREGQLGELDAELADALSGRGRLVFVGGEAGVGKSALVREFAASQSGRVVVRSGGVDNVTTADAFAAFRDAVPEVGDRLAAGDRVRLFRALRSALSVAPGILVLEDLHWADELSLDGLRYLGRRLDGMPVLILATYRDEEVSARHRLTTVMGDLATASGVRRMPVPALTVDGVAALVAHAGASAVPEELHARTQGNAFFVTELLAADAVDLPATVRDAVLARVSALPSDGQDVAHAAAVLGTVASADLLMTVAARSADAVDAAVDSGVLVRDGDGYAYRHELARRAVEGSLSEVRRRQLHGRAFRALEERAPEDHRTLAHHAAGNGDDVAAARHAALAGRYAARLGAHREAAAHYRMALAHGATDEARAGLFVALSYECYLTDQLKESITARQRAFELHELAGDAIRMGDDLRWLSRLSWFLGRGADAERYGARAIESLEPLPPGPELAMAYSNQAQLRMLADDHEEATRWGERALTLATLLGETETQAHALNNLGTAAVNLGDIVQGEALLQRSLDLALVSDLHEHAARAYTNVSSTAARQHRFTGAIAFLDAGIAYCDERDLDSWARYMRAWRGLVLADLGRFDEASNEALGLLAHDDLAPVSAIPARVALIRARSRRGEDVTDHLARASELAGATGELQRIAPVACAAAEDAWLRGDLLAIGELTEGAWALALRHPDAWAIGELAWWRMLGGLPVPVGPSAQVGLPVQVGPVQAELPVQARTPAGPAADVPTDAPVAPPFAALLDGDGAVAWDALGSPIWS
ncbi:MAG: ATP-binding protein, partial [Humibacter sp.]